MISIRDAVPDDDEAVAIVCASGLEDLRKVYRPSPEAYAARASFDHQLARIVAVIDSEVVGTAQYFLDADSVRIIGLMVRADCRRRGIAAALVARLDGIAVEAGRAKLAARTIKETNNLPVFQRLGFLVEDERPDTLFVSDLYARLTEVDSTKPINTGTIAEQAMECNRRQYS